MKRPSLPLCALPLLLLFAAACGNRITDQTNPAPSSTAAQPGAGNTAAPAAITFNGTYRSTWGDTTFVQTGTAVAATYPGGTMACTAAGSTLDCTWKEGGAAGKALLAKQPDGRIAGTWGNGPSDKDGGQWTFAPKK
jgi:hypothetical protein